MDNQTITPQLICEMYAEMLAPFRKELAELRGEQTSQEKVINPETLSENEDN